MLNFNTSSLQKPELCLTNFKVLLSNSFFRLNICIRKISEMHYKNKNVIVDQNKSNTNNSIDFIISNKNKTKRKLYLHLDIDLENFRLFKRFLNFENNRN